MKKSKDTGSVALQPDDDDMLPEYDFSNGVRGKFHLRVTKPITIMLMTDEESSAYHARNKSKPVRCATTIPAKNAKRKSR